MLETEIMISVDSHIIRNHRTVADERLLHSNDRTPPHQNETLQKQLNDYKITAKGFSLEYICRIFAKTLEYEETNITNYLRVAVLCPSCHFRTDKRKDNLACQPL